MSVLIVGTVAYDTIETPFGRAERILGGSATYSGLSSQYFAAPVRVVSVVGEDFDAEHWSLLETRGLDLTGVQREEDGKTFAWEGRYHYDLNHRDTLATHLNVLETFRPHLPEGYRNSRIVCLGNLDPTIQSEVLDQVEHPELVICDTMNFWIEHTPEALRQLLQRIDVLIINDSEARELAQVPNLIRAARIIRRMGPDVLVIKKGEHGALLFLDDMIFSAPAYPLEDVQDPTGAGDTFAGGFAGYLAGCSDIDENALKMAVIYGSVMASFVVEAFGPYRLLDLERADINQRMEEFRQLSAVPTEVQLL